MGDIFGNDRYKYMLDGLKFSLLVTAFAAVIGVVIGVVVALLSITDFKPFKFLKGKKFLGNGQILILFIYCNNLC